MKKIAKSFKKLDKRLSKELGLDGHNLGQIIKQDSDNHKAAMRDLKGLDSTSAETHPKFLQPLTTHHEESGLTSHAGDNGANQASTQTVLTQAIAVNPSHPSALASLNTNNAVLSLNTDSESITNKVVTEALETNKTLKEPETPDNLEFSDSTEFAELDIALTNSNANQSEDQVSILTSKLTISSVKDTSINGNGVIGAVPPALIAKADKFTVWVKTLLEHKHLTTGDKLLLPRFFTTKDEVIKLIDGIANETRDIEDISYITVTSELTTEILGLYPKLDFST